MFGDKFNLGSLMKNAKKMQQMMEQKQADMAKMEFHGESGAGAVKITMDSKYYVKSIQISEEIQNESAEIRDDLIVAAINDAVRKVENTTKSMMMDVSDLLGGAGTAE